MKRTSKITPGEWRVEATGNGFDVVSEDGVLVADAFPDSREDYGLPSAGIDGDDETQANAQHIAAIPDFVAALEKALGALGRDRTESKRLTTIRAIRAALEKARR